MTPFRRLLRRGSGRNRMPRPGKASLGGFEARFGLQRRVEFGDRLLCLALPQIDVTQITSGFDILGHQADRLGKVNQSLRRVTLSHEGGAEIVMRRSAVW